MNMRTLSLAALTLLDVPPPEQVRIAARTGFTHVGLGAAHHALSPVLLCGCSPPHRPTRTTTCWAIPPPSARRCLR